MLLTTQAWWRRSALGARGRVLGTALDVLGDGSVRQVDEVLGREAAGGWIGRSDARPTAE